MRHQHNSRFGTLALLALPSLLASACAAPVQPEPEEEQIGSAAEALVSVGQPNFSVPNIGYWCNAIYPSAGWTFNWGALGDENANPCAGNTGNKIRTGMYSSGWNIAEVWCAPNYYWVYEEWGAAALQAAFSAAANAQTNGNCVFRVTPGTSLRQPLTPPTPPTLTPLPVPAASPSYTFNTSRFISALEAKFPSGQTGGYQLAVRDPQGNLLSPSVASGWAAINTSPVPNTAMTTSRRMDLASVSKTLTGAAMMAAFEDIASGLSGQNNLGITLDSSIKPYLPSNWTVPSSVANITFRMLLQHKGGLCSSNSPTFNWLGDKYDKLQTMVQNGANTSLQGTAVYCDGNYALMRVLLPYVVDGPQAYQPFESNPTLSSEITALSYRNYVRGRVLAPIGLAAVDDFYTGPSPETVYYNGSAAIPDNLNVPGSGYDETADNMVQIAGSGMWTMSAEEVSLLASSLWQGKIVSPTSLSSLIGQSDGVGFGNWASNLSLLDGTNHWDFNHNGEGGANAPNAIWMTFFNGYTVAYVSNSSFGLAYSDLEAAALPAFVPSTWTCYPGYYDAHDGCDCNCGAWDPDCNITPAEYLYCTDPGAVGPSTGSSCNPANNQCH